MRTLLICCSVWLALTSSALPPYRSTHASVLAPPLPAPPDDVYTQAEIYYRLRPGVLRAMRWEECTDRRPCPTSGAGAITFMQIMPLTARTQGCPHEWYTNDAETIWCAARILAAYIAKCGGRVMEGIGRYNAGKCIVKGTYAQPVYQGTL